MLEVAGGLPTSRASTSAAARRLRVRVAPEQSFGHHTEAVTAVPWVTLTPEQVERVVGVLLCREHRHALRLRPSRGDGGVDVFVPVEGRVVDVFQIKSFATRLDPSRKRQIVRSLERVAVNGAFKVRSWHLVVPLNPTPENLAWFEDVTKSLPFECHWVGLDRLDGLAAAYPDVIDYYIDNGRRRLEESIALLRELAGITETPSTGLVAPGELTSSLGALYRALNRDDPHYRYEFEVGERPPAVPPLRERPWLVASVTVGSDDVAVTHHVYARYQMATEDAPLPLKFNVQPGRFDEATAAAWDRALTYGTPVELPLGTVTDVEMELPGGLGAALSEAGMRIYAARSRRRPYRVRVRAIDESDVVLAEVVVQMAAPTTGLRGGIRSCGVDVGGAFDFELLVAPADSEPEQPVVHASFRLRDLAGGAPAAIAPGVRFLGTLHSPNRLQFAAEFGPPATDTIDIPVNAPPVTEELVELAGALAELQQSVRGGLVFPSLDELTYGEYRRILLAARLVRGETIEDRWESCELELTEEVDEMADGPMQLALSGEYRVAIGDQVVVVSPVTLLLLAAQLTCHRVAGRSRLTAVPALGNDTRLTMRAPIDDVPPRSVAPTIGA